MEILGGMGDFKWAKQPLGKDIQSGKNANNEAKGPREMKPRVLLMTGTQEVGGNLGDWDMIYMFI